MLGAHGYAPVYTLQGEVGASGVVARDIKQKPSYQKYPIDCDNDVLHEVYEDNDLLHEVYEDNDLLHEVYEDNDLLHEVYEDVMRNEAEDWNRTVREYCGRPALVGGELKKMNKLELRSRILRLM